MFVQNYSYPSLNTNWSCEHSIKKSVDGNLTEYFKLDKQVECQQTALVTEYESTPTCFGCCPQRSSGSINTERRIYRYCTACQS